MNTQASSEKYYLGKVKVHVISRTFQGVEVELLEDADVELFNFTVGTHTYECRAGFRFITDSASLKSYRC